MERYSRIPDTRRTDPSDASLDRRSVRRSNILGNSFELLFALSAILTGIYYITTPAALEESAVAKSLDQLSYLWGAAYTFSGTLIWFGLLRPKMKMELLGLYLLMPVAFTDGLALLFTKGPVSFKYAVAYIGLTVASGFRLFLLLKVASRFPSE